MRLPDFIIGGAARSGTTWLWHLADRHDQVAMARPIRPEPKFFSDQERFARGLSYYSETWFENLPEGRVLGEKSTSYIEHPSVSERMRAALPSVRLIFLLRDPVAR